jgi:hypothetical protein
MKTAVEWLYEQINECRDFTKEELLEQAKKMERRQHYETFNESRLTHPMIGFKHETFKDYWNETNT